MLVRLLHFSLMISLLALSSKASASLVGIENLPMHYHGMSSQVVRVDARQARMLRVYNSAGELVFESEFNEFQEGLQRVRFVAELGEHEIELFDETGFIIERVRFGSTHGLELFSNPIAVGEFISASESLLRIDVDAPLSDIKEVSLCYQTRCVQAQHSSSAIERLDSGEITTTSWLAPVQQGEEFYLLLNSHSEGLIRDDNKGLFYLFPLSP